MSTSRSRSCGLASKSEKSWTPEGRPRGSVERASASSGLGGLGQRRSSSGCSRGRCPGALGAEGRQAVPAGHQRTGRLGIGEDVVDRGRVVLGLLSWAKKGSVSAWTRSSRALQLGAKARIGGEKAASRASPSRRGRAGGGSGRPRASGGGARACGGGHSSRRARRAVSGATQPFRPGRRAQAASGAGAGGVAAADDQLAGLGEELDLADAALRRASCRGRGSRAGRSAPCARGCAAACRGRPGSRRSRGAGAR
jgi:hypothetical protein